MLFFNYVRGLSFISNRQRRKEGTFYALELAGIEPMPARSGRAGSIILPCGCQCCVSLLAASTNTGPVHRKLAVNCIARPAVHMKGVQEEHKGKGAAF